MLTREEILTLPADQLAEVSARMMGRKFWLDSLQKPLVLHPVDGNPVDGSLIVWKPQRSHNQAREVADWVLPKLKDDERQAKAFFYRTMLLMLIKLNLPANHWTLLFHTPEQLTRASLVAFVDNGGEIE